jgi:hypothetical protein
MGKSRGTPHKFKSKSKREPAIHPIICFDYMFLDGKSPTLVYRDKMSRTVFAHTVTQKGIGDGWILNKVVDDLDSLGYGRIIVKSDQEPAIKNLQAEVRQMRWEELQLLMKTVKDKRGVETDIDLCSGETILENSPAGDSKANGFIERAIQELEGQVRTVKAATKKLIGAEIPRGHCLLAWLIEWCCTIINRCSKGEDGRTPMQKIRGRESHRELCEFGESILWKPLKTAANKRCKDEPKYEEGYWLGVIDRTDEAIIGTSRGVVRCREIKRRPEEDHGGGEGLLNVCGWPSAPNPSRKSDQIQASLNTSDDEDEEDVGVEDEVTADVDVHVEGDASESTDRHVVEEVDQMRSMKITRRDVLKYGRSKKCSACSGADANGVAKKGHSHTDDCRKRMQELMKQDSDDRIRLESHVQRTEWRMAERIERDENSKRARVSPAETPAPSPAVDSKPKVVAFVPQPEAIGATPKPVVETRPPKVATFVPQPDTVQPCSSGSSTKRNQTEEDLEELVTDAEQTKRRRIEAIEKVENDYGALGITHTIKVDKSIEKEKEQRIILLAIAKKIEYHMKGEEMTELEAVKRATFEVTRMLERREDEESWKTAWDDVKKRELDYGKVMVARGTEVDYIRKSKLYNKVPRAKCWEETGKAPIKSGWVDTNKGDEDCPNYRSRWVGKEFNTGKEDGLFAATPPLEALRLLVSELATSRKGRARVKRMLICDVSRAYFYAPVVKKIFVELPDEDKTEGLDEVAELNFSLYGTRAAAASWHKRYSDHLRSLGFLSGASNPCLFYHPQKELQALVHGDDYAIVGEDAELNWIESEIRKEFEIKTTRFGPGSHRRGRQAAPVGPVGEKSEVSILGRILEWRDEGITFEADPRHAEIIIRELGLAEGKPVTTPGVKAPVDTEEEEGEELQNAEATKYRSIAARVNYLALDRGDLTYAAKEGSRKMSKPHERDWGMLKRVGRYLKYRPRAVLWYRWQEDNGHVEAFTDSDWAGCRMTRRSTTGGALMRGDHLLKTYSKTQTTIALSSGEAELYATVRASSEVLGICSIARDWGLELLGRVWADASAALGIVGRQGLGKVRHLDTNVLWVQEAALRKRLLYCKVKGEHNIADLMTKYLDHDTLTKHSLALGIVFPETKSSIALSAGALYWNDYLSGRTLNNLSCPDGRSRQVATNGMIVPSLRKLDWPRVSRPYCVHVQSPNGVVMNMLSYGSARPWGSANRCTPHSYSRQPYALRHSWMTRW